jgi:outer membrane protein assembly factor BamE (lipoprotein component of BamABCDE complex)
VKKWMIASVLILSAAAITGCSTPSQRVAGLRLGMTPDEVMDTMGRPYAIRAAKLFDEGNFQEVWEYIPSVFSVALFADRYDKDYWIYFNDGRLVQWGEPADFTGTSTISNLDRPAVQEFRGQPAGRR